MINDYNYENVSCCLYQTCCSVSSHRQQLSMKEMPIPDHSIPGLLYGVQCKNDLFSFRCRVISELLFTFSFNNLPPQSFIKLGGQRLTLLHRYFAPMCPCWMLLITRTGNGERGTGNGEPGTGNREPESGNKSKAATLLRIQNGGQNKRKGSKRNNLG